MKTVSKIFATLFLALAICAGAATLAGATHQIYISGLCLVMALVLYPECGKSDKVNS